MPTVSLENKNLQFQVDEGEVVFDAIDNQGEKLPHGCLAGSCGACRIEVLEGADNLKPPSVVEQNTLDAIKESFEKRNGKGSLGERIIRLSCRARILGDIKIRPFR